jgi:hypothetical protein
MSCHVDLQKGTNASEETAASVFMVAVGHASFILKYRNALMY